MSHTIKKALVFLLIMAISVFMIFGCSSKTSTPNENKSDQNTSAGTNNTASSKSEPVKLNYWTSNELHQAIYEFGAEAYNKKYPDQPVELIGDVYPNAEMHNKLLIALQSNTGAPDIADININYFSNFIKGNNVQLVDLTDIVTPVLDKMVKSRFEIYAKDGKYYGLPTHIGATVVYYNKEITDKAGVDIDAIKTWDDYVKAGKQVVEKAGVPMTAFEVSNQRPFWPMIVQRGGDYLAPDGSVVLDSKINIDTLQFMYDMVFKDKIAIPMPGGDTTKEEFWTFMDQGGMASLIMPSWYMSRFLNYMPDLKGKIYVRPMPVYKDGGPATVGMGGTATSITVQCKNVDIAKKLITEAKLTPEAGINIWQKLMFDPVRTDIWDKPELLAPSEYFGNESYFKVMGPYLKDAPSPVNGELSSAAQDLVISTVMYKVFVEKSATPEQALKSAADELRKMKK